MKPKILLCGSNQTLKNDFFNQMDFSFECMLTSTRWDDTMCHIKYFQPDLIVYCLYRETRDVLTMAARLKMVLVDKDIPVAVIGDNEDCSEFSRIAPGLAQLELYRPISTKDIEAKLKKFIENRNLQKKIMEESIKEAEEEKKARDLNEFMESMESPELNMPGMDIPEMEIPAEMMPVPEEEEPAGQKHILIVDDDVSMLRMMKNFLSENYQVATAISGKVALKFLEAKHTDLVLLDYEMPGESGSYVLKQIRRKPELKKLPVVFLTGVTDKTKIQDVLSNNIQGYLLKPIDMERLSNTITELIG